MTAQATTKPAAGADARQTAKPFSPYGVELSSRLLLGTARYPSPHVMSEAVKASGAEIVTVSLRRETARANADRSTGGRFFDLIKQLGVRVLPNTAGCRTPKEAIATAQMARELFGTDWIKLEVIGNDDTLQPDLFGLVEAAAALTAQGFKVFPYTTEDLIAAERLVAAGCQVLMPWGAPIGTGRGLANRYALQSLRRYFPGRAARDRRRHRRALACCRGHGAGLRCGHDQHGRRDGRRPGADGARLRGGHRGGPPRLRGRADADARHGGAVDAGGGHAVLQPRAAAVSRRPVGA